MRKARTLLASLLLCFAVSGCQAPFSAQDGIEGPQERFVAAQADLTAALALLTETAEVCAPEPRTHPCWRVVTLGGALAQDALDAQAEAGAIILSGDPDADIRIDALLFAIDKLRAALPKE